MNAHFFKVKLPVLLIAVVSAVASLVVPAGSSQAAGSATMYIQQITPMVVGSTLTVQVRVNTAGVRTNSVETDFTYPTGVLAFSSIDNASLSAYEINAQSTGGSGTVTIARGTSASGGIAGDFKVANISFTVLSAGSATLALQNSSVLLDVNSSSDILGTRTNGSFTSVNGLAAGQVLASGSTLSSNNTQYRVVMQTDGNLVIYSASNQVRWFTGTAGNPGARAVMQTDGNLVVYTPADKPLWSTTTNGFSGAAAVMQDDGNLAVYNVFGRPTWSTVTGPFYLRLTSGQTLNTGDILNTPNAQFRAIVQSDGNFVLYNAANAPLWHTATNGNPGARLVMQSDGNLVIYTTVNKPLWSTGTSGNAGSSLVMQSDGNLVLYSATGRPLWSRLTGRI